MKNIQDCVSEDSKALNSHCTKAFGEGYVISKTKVKQNFLVLVNDYFKKVHLEQFRKKRMLQEKMWYYFKKEVNHIYYQLRFLVIFFFYVYALGQYFFLIDNKLNNS